MTGNTVMLNIVTDHGELFSGAVYSVNLNTTSGFITVLPNHTPLVSVLAPGKITVTHEDNTETFEAKEGIIDVRPNKINILLHNGN